MISRASKNLKLKKKYLFICEGARTEPDYIEGIIRNRCNLGIDALVDLKPIPKLKMDTDESDLARLIKIAKDYANYCIKGTTSRRLAVTLTFESAYEALKTSKKFMTIVDKNKKYRELRAEIDERLDAERIPLEDVKDENLHRVCEVCREVFKENYNVSMDECLKPSTLEKQSIVAGDEICIIHDRDYSKKYFPDSKYMKACKDVDSLNRGKLRYRLIITYPKFEFWMLLHSNKVDVNSLNYNKLKNYPGASEYVDELIDKNLDIWEKGSSKRIDAKKFDKELSPCIKLAISNSENPKLTHDLLELCSRPGTSMGMLMKDLLA